MSTGPTDIAKDFELIPRKNNTPLVPDKKTSGKLASSTTNSARHLKYY